MKFPFIIIRASRYEGIWSHIDNLEKQLYRTPLFCEVCGCVLHIAIKGKPEIKDVLFPDNLYRGEHYIYYPYYCLIHAPKDDEADSTGLLKKKGE